MSIQPATMIRSFLALGVMIVAVLVAVLLSAESGERGSRQKSLGGDFTLNNIDGEVSLQDFRDQIVVLYFGFLSCRKVCPTSMNVLTRAFNTLEEEELAQTQAILVSVDPKRDTYEDLEAYTKEFHPNILGVTGEKENVKAVAQNYHAFYRQSDSELDESDYKFRHSSRFYIVNRDGKLVDAMRHSTTANELAARIRTLL